MASSKLSPKAIGNGLCPKFRGSFGWFNAASTAARQARFEQGEHGSICEEQMAGFLQEQPGV
jgi:hypothetical protein